MGDRGNIRLKQPNGQSIWLYTHWSGTEMPATLQAGMKLGIGREYDPSYYNRSIITEFTRGARDGDNTGFGVSLDPGDNEHDILEVDLAEKRVRVRSAKGYFDEEPEWDADKADVLGEWTFEEYLALPPDKLPEV